MPVFETRTELNVPAAKVFDFITRPANMKSISPPEVDMVLVEAPEELTTGSKLVFKVQAFGVSQQLEHEIVDFSPPRSFREQMIKGPLQKWQHDYLVEPTADGGSVLTNRIEFEPPGGMLGMLLTADRIMKHLEEGYAHRSEALKQALES